jgi:predicted anti-sigma-YlaC factor YlaD
MDSVDCSVVRTRLVSGEPLEGEGVDAHLGACEGCSALVADAAGLAEQLRESALIAPPSVPEDPVLENVRDEQGVFDRLRAMPTRARATAVGVLIALVSVAVALGTPRADLGVFPIDRLLTGLGLLVVGITAGFVVALHPAYRAFRLGRAAIAVLLACAIPVALALFPPAHEAHPASLAGVDDDLVKRAMACFLFGTACAVPIVIAGWVWARRGLRRGWVAASAWVAAAAVGNLALLLHCPLTAVVHRTAGHASIALVFALLGMAAYAGLRRR